MSLLEESFEPPLPKVVPVEGVTPVSPIPTFTLRRGVAGEETELVVQTFDDRILVVVTQNGKVGCLVSEHWAVRPN
jgi:hypothetical protein